MKLIVMIFLPETVEIHGTGIPGLTAKLIARNEKKAMYLRSDGYYEVFKRKFVEDSEVFGRHYPAHEQYPGNEDFGKIAWCMKSREKARRRFNEL